MWATCENNNKKRRVELKELLNDKRGNFQKLKHLRKKNVVSLNG